MQMNLTDVLYVLLLSLYLSFALPCIVHILPPATETKAFLIRTVQLTVLH